MTKKLYTHNEEEMLQKLKDEIIRIGLESTPSRLKIQKLYNRENMPHPLAYMRYFGSWDTIMKRIGLENTRINKDTTEKVRQQFFYWEDFSDEEWLEKLKDELCRVGLNENPSINKLRKVYDKRNIVHPTTYVVKFGSWEAVLRLIETDDRIKRNHIRKPNKIYENVSL